MESKPRRIAVIGIGNSGREHLDNLMNLRQVTIVAVCDPDLDACHFGMNRAGVRGFADYSEMLEEIEFDIALVCTPHDLHKDIVEGLAHRGVHVLKEKPLARTLDEAHALIEIVDSHGVRLGIVAQRRFHPTYFRAKQYLCQLGEIFMIRAEHVFDSNPRNFGWRGKQSIAGGGTILDSGYHMIDLVCRYFGLPEEIWAYSTATARPEVEYDTEDTASISFKYPSGMMGNIFVSRAALPKEERMLIYGSEATLLVTRTDLMISDRDGRILEKFITPKSWAMAFQEQFQDFLRGNISGQIFQCSASTHLPTMAFIEAAYSSRRNHTPARPYINRQPNFSFD